jgi:hypothetical protein
MSYLLQAVLGHNEAALKMIESEDQSNYEICIAKAQILIKLGRPADALKVLDGTSQDTPIQKYYVF